MNDLNYIFFEEYKRLDKLCGELYNTPYGVTHYIDDMKSAPRDSYRRISSWNTDLRELIRLRHIRNYLAHAEGAFHEENLSFAIVEASIIHLPSRSVHSHTF